MSAADTVFAPASGTGRAAVAVLRLSGPDTARILQALCQNLPPPRHAGLRRLLAADGDVLDRALVLWFPGPASYTGEDCAELHLHGGRAVTEVVANRLIGLGARPAEPGEFTRRAFCNGRMDLLEAEAIADLVDSETDSQRKQALRQMEGALGALYGDWAGRLRRVLAHQEALIDFPDEDLPPETEAALRDDMAGLHSEMAAHLADAHRGERLRDGLMVAVLGAPNVGKSSLVNALAGRDVAIVSATPGTTRDTLETRLVLGGVPVTLVDTAGLRETEDAIEAEGVRRARARREEADLVLEVVDARDPLPGSPAAGLRIANKSDLAEPAEPAGPDILWVSARTGAGLDILRERLSQCVAALTAQSGPPPLTRARHRAAVTEAAAELTRAMQAPLPELRAEGLRLSMQALGRITGSIGVEDLLDTVFRSFCIGK